MSKVMTGLDLFREKYWKRFKGYKIGLLSNQASLDSHLSPAKAVISRQLPGQLKALFGPQHGYGGQDQDNMVETGHAFDHELKIPVFSLYAKHREPLPEMLDLIDILIIDLQDVGTRVYTFASTMLHCLRAATGAGIKVLILDRPNPLGGETIEGNLLNPELYSFVGSYSLPMRHGFTMAEMALMFDHVFNIDSDLETIAMEGWRRHMLWHQTDLKWIMPSPNMPLLETAEVYPGQVIWEGTNISEGRGTCRPFEIFGAPFLNLKSIKAGLKPEMIRGCHLQEISFRPTFHKWQGEYCHGFMIHILDRRSFQPYFTTISLLKRIIEIHGDRLEWKEPPYEYEFDRMPIDLIIGDKELRHAIEKGEDLYAMKKVWPAESKGFLEMRRQYLLYT